MVDPSSSSYKPETEHWVKLAKQDYQTALYLFKGAKHPWAVYIICMAIEKLLKGAQIELLNQVPKKIHDLESLAIQSGLPFTDEQIQICSELTTHYNRVRYQDLSQVHYNTKRKVQPILEQAKIIYLWINAALTNH